MISPLGGLSLFVFLLIQHEVFMIGGWGRGVSLLS